MVKYLNAYDRALINIGNTLEQMGQITAGLLTQAIEAFVAQDLPNAQAVISRDDEIDTLDETIEREALDLISLQQPVDYDLRFLNAAMHISRELERISDYSCDIAEAVLQLHQTEPFFKPLTDLTRMVEAVQGMLAQSLKAHFDKDLVTASQMDTIDKAVDDIFNSLQQELVGYMKTQPECIEQASVILLVIRYLERIGDHIVNISEMTIFAETGERHPFKAAKPSVQQKHREDGVSKVENGRRSGTIYG
ncbi:MAG TPA: phosphate signaling complex protein PhoU [Bacillota bacterium]